MKGQASPPRCDEGIAAYWPACPFRWAPRTPADTQDRPAGVQPARTPAVLIAANRREDLSGHSQAITLGVCPPVDPARCERELGDQGPLRAVGPHLEQPERGGALALEAEHDPLPIRGVGPGESGGSAGVVMGQVPQIRS